MVDDRRHLLLRHPGVHIQIRTARLAFVERRIDKRCFSAGDDRQARVARSTCLHRDQYIHLLLKDECVERLLGTGGARTVVGDVKRKRPSENAALGVDLFDRKFRRLHDGRGNDRVCPREAHRHPDPDGIGRRGRR